MAEFKGSPNLRRACLNFPLSGAVALASRILGCIRGLQLKTAVLAPPKPVENAHPCDDGEALFQFMAQAGRI